MNHSSAGSAFRRRLVRGAVVPAVALSTFSFVSPAQAASAPAGGICSGVVNQLSHRGMVQENLLKAAAKRNAVVIAGLVAERATLQESAASLQGADRGGRRRDRTT